MKRKEVLLGLGVLVVTLLFLGVLIEVAIRMIGVTAYDYPKDMFQIDDKTDYSLTPNYNGVFEKSEFKTEVHTNALGFRDKDYEQKNEKEYRIVALGDSFTWGGYGTDLEETFIKVLERELNIESELDYSVINTGSPGYGTDQESQVLQYKTQELEPDMILVNFFVGNDFFDNLETGEMTVKDGLLVRQNDDNTLNKIRFFLQKNLHTYRLVERALLNMFGGFIESHVREAVQDDSSQKSLFLETLVGSEAMNKTIDILDEIKDYTDSEGIQLAVVVIPIKYQVSESLMNTFIQNNLAEETVYDMELPQKIINKWGESRDVQVIDLLPFLKEQNDGLYWPLNPHFNVEGNEAVGLYVHEELEIN